MSEAINWQSQKAQIKAMGFKTPRLVLTEVMPELRKNSDWFKQLLADNVTDSLFLLGIQCAISKLKNS
jgi:hypothetical protein